MKLKRTHLADDKLDRVLEDYRSEINSLQGGMFADAKFLTEDGSKDLVFTAGTTKVFRHGLGRDYNGFIVAYRLGPYEAYVDSSIDVDDSEAIALVTTNNVTLRIIIF